MAISNEEHLRWSRYGMEPYNWIIENRLMSSVYPVEKDYITYLRENEGIRYSINLAETPWPEEWQRETGMMSYHFPIIDMSTPGEEEVRRIIELIDANDDPVMIHCAAGIGRTGTIMALYLVDHGIDPADAISLVRKKRHGSIQTSAQEMMVHHWARK